MKDLVININNKIEVEWDKKYYKSNIMDVNDKFITINIPMLEGGYLTLSKGDYIEVTYYNSKDIYKFHSKVIGRDIKDNLHEIYIEHPKDVKKVQRRNYVRVFYGHNIKYYILKDKLNSNINLGQGIFEDAIIIDISGGGMKIKTSKELSLGDIIISKLTIDDTELFVKGRVLRSIKDENKQNICGISFIDMDGKTIEKVIQFVFLLMRKQRNAALKEG
ncbi:flagellar brake protein [Clostridium algidicarnis]|uniref:flagellar brake protein n=1 Tax=Clostridium algidicarnis TaxID=37659 RepID=UPI0004972C30|nr:flagellar brake domain-containing protein [Clostridium algidicarnis]